VSRRESRGGGSVKERKSRRECRGGSVEEGVEKGVETA
jgi:hypothetical protein